MKAPVDKPPSGRQNPRGDKKTSTEFHLSTCTEGTVSKKKIDPAYICLRSSCWMCIIAKPNRTARKAIEYWYCC